MVGTVPEKALRIQDTAPPPAAYVTEAGCMTHSSPTTSS
jgi:hypothetical protein